MDILFSKGALSGRIAAIPSKSDAHRILIAAALSKTPTEILLPALSEDMEATIACLRALGAHVWQNEPSVCVTPAAAVPAADIPAHPKLNVSESGSTLRFLMPLAGVIGRPVSFSGRGRLPDRPQGPLIDALSASGMAFSARRLPFTATGMLSGGEFLMPGNVSSQFVTGLLFALPLTKEGGRITLTPPVESKSYVDMTVRTLKTFGIAVFEEENAYLVPGAQAYCSPGQAAVEGDWSNAAFWLCAGAIGQSKTQGVTVTGLSASSAQGDRAVLPLLLRFGARVLEEGGQVTVSPGQLHGIEIDAADIPDLALPLAMVAACAFGTTRFTNMGRLRMKESDRLAALEEMICTLCGQGRARVDGDELYVTGGPVAGGTISARGDHRLVMSAALLGLAAEKGVKVSGAQAVAKSYPHFVSDYQSLGGNAHELNGG